MNAAGPDAWCSKGAWQVDGYSARPDMSTKLTYPRSALSQALPTAVPPAPGDEPAYDLIELFFFAYRDFVEDPDRILAEYGFGRAHHRVLHFVARQPGLTVADLLDTLRITKQSLNRVLKELIETGFVEQRTGRADRRQRLLFATGTGGELALRLARLQTGRISQALAAAGGPRLRADIARFLGAMADPPVRPEVRAGPFGAKLAP